MNVLFTGGGGVEKRRDTNGEAYTKVQFVAEYGGTKEWYAAPLAKTHRRASVERVTENPMARSLELRQLRRVKEGEAAESETPAAATKVKHHRHRRHSADSGLSLDGGMETNPLALARHRRKSHEPRSSPLASPHFPHGARRAREEGKLKKKQRRKSTGGHNAEAAAAGAPQWGKPRELTSNPMHQREKQNPMLQHGQTHKRKQKTKTTQKDASSTRTSAAEKPNSPMLAMSRGSGAGLKSARAAKKKAREQQMEEEALAAAVQRRKNARAEMATAAAAAAAAAAEQNRAEEEALAAAVQRRKSERNEMATTAQEQAAEEAHARLKAKLRVKLQAEHEQSEESSCTEDSGSTASSSIDDDDSDLYSHEEEYDDSSSDEGVRGDI